MVKKISSFLLLICLLFNLFTGVQQVFAESDPPTVEITSPVYETYNAAGYDSFYYNQAITATADVRDSRGNPVTGNIRWYYRKIDNVTNPIVELGTQGNQITFNPAAIPNGLFLNSENAYCIYLNAEYTDPVTNLTAAAPAQGSVTSGRKITISPFLSASIAPAQATEGEITDVTSPVTVTGRIQTNGLIPEGAQATIALYNSDKTALRNVDNSKIQASGTVSGGNATITLQIPTQYRAEKNAADLPMAAGDYLVRLNIGGSIRFFPYEIKAQEDNHPVPLLQINKTEVVKGTTVAASVYDAVYAGQTVCVVLWEDGEVVYSYEEQSEVFVDVLLDETGKGQEALLIPLDVPAGDYELKIIRFTGDDREVLDPGVALKVIEPEINKQVLQTAIAAARTNKATAAVSMDGSDIVPASQWVSQGQMTAYETAIASAQGIYGTADSTQVEVDQAAASLAAATESFNAAKKAGTKQITYPVTFSAAENGTLTAAVDGLAIQSGAAVAAGKTVVFTASPAQNYRVKQWTVGGVAVPGNKNNTLTLANLQAAKVVTLDFGEAANIDYTVSREEVAAALEKATVKLIEKFDDSGFNYQQHWMAIALRSFDKTVPSSYLNAIKAELNLAGDEAMPDDNSGQYGKYILGILAAGGDPTDISGRNLLAELCELSDMKHVNAEGGIYTTPFGLLALDAVNYEIPANAGFTRDDLVNKLITLASPTGGEDGVGFVLTALGKYYNEKPTVKTAVDTVISAWASRQGADGGFGAGVWSTENNVNTAAQVLMGVSFNGKDAQSPQFTKADGNLVSFLLSLQNPDGTFNWQKKDPGSISMATEQAVYALAQYLRQLDGRKSIYDFTPTATDKAAPVISTDLEDKTVNASGFTFAASANDAVDGNVDPVVKIDGKQISGTAGNYKIVLKQGNNVITVTATDLSGNRAEKTYTIVYVTKTQDIPAGNQPRIDIPADNNDYRIQIPSNGGDKEITIEIPEAKSAAVIVDLPSNGSLPQIEAVKGEVTVLIPKGTQVTGGNSSGVELITSVDSTDNALKAKLKDILPKGKELGSIVQAFSLGSGENIEFSDFIVLTFKGMHGKEAAYIQNGTVHGIQKYTSDSGGLSSGKPEYAYDAGNDLIVKTKHFTDFIAYTVNAAETPDNGGNTPPQPVKYVTLSVDKLTIHEGYVIPSAQTELRSGDTAWTLLKRELDRRSISCKYIWSATYGSVYVQSIDGDGEFDHGSGSGWMYSVNGWYPNYGATKYILKEGDVLQWRYTTNLGADLGEDLSQWENKDGTKPTDGQDPVISPEGTAPGAEIPQNNPIDLKKVYKDESAISIWAYEAIGAATQKGFVTGSSGKFNPRDSNTRAEFAKLMVSALGLDLKADKAINFTDVKETDWFYPYVNAAYKAGIVKGSGGKFSPNDKINREQMAAMVVRALGVKPLKPGAAIKDIDAVADGFKTDVETSFAMGLMVGDGGQFNPGAFATREMAVVVAMRAYAFLSSIQQ